MDSAYQPLSARDASFLVFEGATTPMNVGGMALFEGGSLVTRGGGVDVDRIRSYIASQLHLIPRYRQRLAYIPIGNQPVWVDDVRFDLDYHVRHTALPRSGDEAQLKRTTADILSRPLDRERPLWELWIIEGLADGGFATVSKAHHCMVDGVSGVDVLSVTMRADPRTKIAQGPRWRPRRPPSSLEMLRDDVLRRARLPLARSAEPARPLRESLRSDLAERLGAVWATMRSGLRSAAGTPLNQPIGSHRRFDWLEIDLAEVKAVKNRLGGTVNDVVLATVAGAVRRFLRRRRSSLRGLDFRVAAPVNMRLPEDHGTLGNRVSVWLMTLPVQERDPRRRLAAVRAATATLKETKQALGAEALMQIIEWTPPGLVGLGTRLAARMNPYNLIVTNVPGPQFPLYMLDARMRAAYPLVPLFDNQGLGIALFSYDNRLQWGFNADWDVLYDLAAFVEDTKTSFAELRAAAATPTVHRHRPKGKPPT